MRLTKLILEQFRNYQNLELNFDLAENVSYIVGPNAQGKTNILESIYLLALTKSFRTSQQQDMIRWGDEFARVQGFFEDGDAANQTVSTNSISSGRPGAHHGPSPVTGIGTQLEAFLGHPPNPQKSFKKNGVKTSAADFIGNCQIVFFHPEDLNMLYLGPDLRRAYLNVINVQVNRKYFTALRSYQKVLKQRNALLHAIKEGRASENDLGIWDEQLVEFGSYLMQERAATVEYFQKHLTETYQKISQGDEKITITYRHTLPGFEPAPGESENPGFVSTKRQVAPTGPGPVASASPAPTLAQWREQFARALAAARPRDLRALITTVGPHRDDLEFSLNGLKLSALASRGEYRSLLLSLKLIELKFFQDRTAQNPILLLDDVFSELDPHRQQMLLQAIQSHQTIITATHLDAADPLDARKHKGLGSTLKHGKLLQIVQGNARA